MKNTIIVILLILSAGNIFAQKYIQGTVVDSIGEPLIGASVLEENTQNGTITNFEGKFFLYLQKESSCLKFSYIGFKDTVACNLSDTTSLKIKMDMDYRNFEKVCVAIDIITYNTTTVGIYSGLLNNPYGFTFSNFTKSFFHIPIKTTVTLDYRTNLKNNSDFHAGIARYRTLKLKKSYLGFAYDYDCIKINSPNTNLNYWSNKFYATWNFKPNYLFLGYGYSKIDNQNHNGILTGIAFNIPKTKNISILAKADYWFNDWEYSAEISKYFNKIPMSISAGYEQLNKYKELNLKLTYQMKY